mgnify:FL=1
MIDIFGKIAYTITRTWFCRILSNHVEMCWKKVHDILSNSSFSIDFSKIIVYTKDRERRFSKNRIRKGFINIKKKFFSKVAAVLAVGAIVTGLSGAMAVPASAIDISSVPGSKFQYTVTTKKISNSKFQLSFRVINNPGVSTFNFAIKNDSGVMFDGNYTTQMPAGSTFVDPALNADKTRLNLIYVTPVTSKKEDNLTYDNLVFTFEYRILDQSTSNHTFHIGITQYNSPNEPDAYFSNTDGVTVPNDATIEVSPSQSVKLGDVDGNNKIDTTDLYYIMEMTERTSSKKVSTTYLDQQLKIKTSEWYKNYPFLKCAAVADIDHDTVIQKADSDALMQYIAEAGAKVEITNKEINTLLPVTVVYDN